MTSLARLPRQNTIKADEAFAFLEVIAPKLEQLRRRLAASKLLLMQGDLDQGRLDAIIESQLAFKEFVAGIANLQEFVEPIDLLLDVLGQESAEMAAQPAAVAPDYGYEPAPAAPAYSAEPAPAEIVEPPPPPRHVETPSVEAREPTPVVANPAPAAATRGDGWLHVGTVIATERLIKAGMQLASAESYVERTYSHIGLTQADGRPISIQDIKAWRAKVMGRGTATWRRSSALMPKTTAGLGRPQPSLSDVTARVDEFAAMFKKMADLAQS